MIKTVNPTRFMYQS